MDAIIIIIECRILRVSFAQQSLREFTVFHRRQPVNHIDVNSPSGRTVAIIIIDVHSHARTDARSSDLHILRRTEKNIGHNLTTCRQTPIDDGTLIIKHLQNRSSRYPRKGTSVGRVYVVFVADVSIVGFFTIRQKRIRGIVR